MAAGFPQIQQGEARADYRGGAPIQSAKWLDGLRGRKAFPHLYMAYQFCLFYKKKTIRNAGMVRQSNDLRPISAQSITGAAQSITGLPFKLLNLLLPFRAKYHTCKPLLHKVLHRVIWPLDIREEKP